MQLTRIEVFIIILFFRLDLVGQAQSQAGLIPRDVLFDLEHRKEMIKLSPDGKKVFYVKNPYQAIPDKKLFYCETAHPDREYAVEFTGGIAAYELLDDKRILVRTLSPAGQSVVIWDLSDQSLKKVLPATYKRIRWLAFSEGKEGAAFVAVPQQGSPLLFTLDFESGQMDSLESIAQGHFPLFFNNKLEVIAGEKTDPATGDKLLDVFKNGQWKTIQQFPWSAERFLRPGLQSIVGVSADGSQVFFTDNTDSDKTRFKVYHAREGKTGTLLPEQPADLMPQTVVLDADQKPLAIACHYSKRLWSVLDDNGKEAIDFLSQKFEDFQVLDRSPDGRLWLVEAMNGGLNWSWLYDSDKESIQKLFSDYPALEKFPAVHRHYEVLPSFDGLSLPVQYYLSEKYDQDRDGIPDRTMPAVVYVHGGPWQGWMEDNWLINRHLQLLADRGYVVVYAQFRGALTYGKAFLKKGNKEWGDAMMKDKVAIAEWLAAHKNIDKDKIGIFGWSYGGYAALAGAAFAPGTYACAISLYGPTYLDAPREENAFGYAPNSLLRIADVTTAEGLVLARQHSPLYKAKDIAIPLLLSTGSLDERVPQMQMDKMAEALHREGKDVTYLVYPNEGHDYRAKNAWTTFWAVGEQFLALHLGGQSEPVQAGEDFEEVEVKFLSKEIKITNK